MRRKTTPATASPEMADLIELLTSWYGDMNRLETDRLIQLLGLGTKVLKLIETTERIVPLKGRGRDKAEPESPRSETPKGR